MADPLTYSFIAKASIKNVGAGSTFDKAAFNAYETVKAERDALKESEAVYKRKVVALEQDSENLLKSYQDIYAENKVLRGKVEHGPGAARIKGFRNEIKKLEEKHACMKSDNALLQEEIYGLQKQLGQSKEDKQRVDDAFKMERGMHVDKAANLEKETKELQEQVEKLEVKCQEYEQRVKTYETESDGLLNRYKDLKHDQMKMEAKFKRQKDLSEEELREVKESNKEMTKEIIQLKTLLAKTQSDYNSLKLEYEAAQKQIEFQTKELEVFKTQTSLLKRNVKVTTREYNSLKDDLKSTENMLEDARSFGFDAVFDERKAMKRKERIHLKRIDELEAQANELSRENEDLDVKLGKCRQKMESAIMEKESMAYSETALKRRIEVLENANLELDRRNNFAFDPKKRERLALKFDGRRNEVGKNLVKENNTLLEKVRNLEMENRTLVRKVRQLESDDVSDQRGEDVTVMSFRRTSSRKGRILRTELPALKSYDFAPSYSSTRSVKVSRSLPSQSHRE